MKPAALLLTLVRTAVLVTAVGFGVAHAAEPTVTLASPGHIDASVWVDAAPRDVLAALSDGALLASLAPDVIDAQAQADGACVGLSVTSRGLLSPVTLRTRRCPTASGWQETLVTSGVFERFDTAWTVSPEGTGSRVDYRVAVEVPAWVPMSVLHSRLTASVTATMRAVSAWW